MQVPLNEKCKLRSCVRPSHYRIVPLFKQSMKLNKKYSIITKNDFISIEYVGFLLMPLGEAKCIFGVLRDLSSIPLDTLDAIEL